MALTAGCEALSPPAQTVPCSGVSIMRIECGNLDLNTSAFPPLGQEGECGIDFFQPLGTDGKRIMVKIEQANVDFRTRSLGGNAECFHYVLHQVCLCVLMPCLYTGSVPNF